MPLTAEQIVIPLVLGLAHRSEHTAGHDIVRAENLARSRFGHIGRTQSRGDRDHHAPARAGVRLGNRRDNFQKVERLQLQTAERCRLGKVECTRFGQLCRQIGGQPAGLFGFFRTRCDLGQQRQDFGANLTEAGNIIL